MGKINVLGFDVANLIAAGEVVDRPASVVKELLENSIDAGATSVTAEIQNGGVTLIRVTDNGCGMEPDDLPVAILPGRKFRASMWDVKVKLRSLSAQQNFLKWALTLLQVDELTLWR